MVKERVEEMANVQDLTSTKYYNRKGIELPNIEGTRGEEYVDAYDYDLYNKDYAERQQTDIGLVADHEVDEEEVDELLADTARYDDACTDDSHISGISQGAVLWLML